MPIDGQPNLRIHRHCRKCREWFDPWEGTIQWPEGDSMIAWLRVKVAQQLEDDSVKTWVCLRCHPQDDDQTTGKTSEKTSGGKSLGCVITALVVLALCALAFLFKYDLYLWAFGNGD